MTHVPLPGEETAEPGPPRAATADPWPGFVVLCVGLLLWFGFQTSALIRDRRNLEAARANQEQLLQQANRVRAQLDAIARGTLQLAQQGNAGAALVVEQLARRGITINPSGTPAVPATPPSK